MQLVYIVLFITSVSLSVTSEQNVWEEKVPGLELMAFDLDKTLWPFTLDQNLTVPFKKTSDGVVIDAMNRKLNPYPEVSSILSSLKRIGYLMAVVSRDSYGEHALDLIDKFGWKPHFDFIEIWDGNKTGSLTQLKIDCSVSFDQMIFFDDKQENIDDANSLGVMAILVDGHGLTTTITESALKQFKSSKRVKV